MLRARGTFLGLLAVLCAVQAPGARADERAWRLGVALGYGAQDVSPLASRDYSHRTAVYKLLASRPLLVRPRLALELELEPFLAASSHRLRNPWFVKGQAGAGLDAARARFTRGETIHEYGVDVGLVGRWSVTPRLSLFLLASIGPMYGDAATERLARGFAFSDIVAGGVALRVNGVVLELRPGFRHVSNGYLQLPNSGHNAAFVLVGVSAAR